MHPGYSDVEGGLKAPKGQLSIFTEPESNKVFGIGYSTQEVDHAAMKVIHIIQTYTCICATDSILTPQHTFIYTRYEQPLFTPFPPSSQCLYMSVAV